MILADPISVETWIGPEGWDRRPSSRLNQTLDDCSWNGGGNFLTICLNL